MTLYRFSSALFVLSVFCLAIAVNVGAVFYILVAWICVVLSGQLYAQGVQEEKQQNPARWR
jgi:hypothetical protein